MCVCMHMCISVCMCIHYLNISILINHIWASAGIFLVLATVAKQPNFLLATLKFAEPHFLQNNNFYNL